MSGAASARDEIPSRFADDETMSMLLAGSPRPALSSEAAQVTGETVSTYPADAPTWKTDYILHTPNTVVPTNAEVHCGDAPPSTHCAVTLSFLLPRPLDRLPEKRIPNEQLPSLDSLLNMATKR